MPLQKHMDSQDQSNSSDSGDSNFELGTKRKPQSNKNKNFQKNFPKNILTSIIASLDHKNYQQVYRDAAISGEEIQRRNSASLNNIHQILTHPLMNPINKHHFEILASNILLQNSKISKKSFHLTLLRQIFSFSVDISLCQFRSEMRKRAKTNSQKDYSNLYIFQCQSSTIYLLTLFCRVMDGYPYLNDEALENRQSTEEEFNLFQNANNHQIKNIKKNREILKPSIKELTIKLNKFPYTKAKSQDIYDTIRDIILNTQIIITQKLNLKPGVPYLRLFCPQVVSICLQKLQQRQKITISNLESWVKDFERITLNSISESLSIITSTQNLFKIQQKEKEKEKEKEKQANNNLKKKYNYLGFFPIVLTHP